MPTVILLDVSLSMCRTVTMPETNEVFSIKHLALFGLNVLLDYIALNSKLEFTSLMLFSSLWERNVPFTRDFESIKNALNNLDAFYDRTNIFNALRGVQDMLNEEWGNNVPCNVLLVTDGNPGISLYTENDLYEDLRSIANFPGRLHIISVCELDENLAPRCIGYYKRILEMSIGSKNVELDEHFWTPENNSVKAVEKLFLQFAEKNYAPFRGTLSCGSLSCPISLFPTLEPLVQDNDFGTTRGVPYKDIVICGFLPISAVASPPVVSRHLVISTPNNKEELAKMHSVLTLKDSSTYELNASTLFDLEEALNSLLHDEYKQPSLCVLLHGSLKVEGMVAICRIGSPNWYGMMYAWADSKKKSNLMLSAFKIGSDAVPWLGDLSKLASESLNLLPIEVKKDEKKSYTSNCVVWTRQANLQTDIQKILRHAKKLPEKAPHFYKELNRFRRAALASGFFEIIEGVANILERECTFLPEGSHPEAALQLTNAVNTLRLPLDSNSYDSHFPPRN